MAYLLERIVPVAERCKVQLCCHLSDPPAPVLRGVERVLGGHDLLHHFVTRQTPDNNPSKPHPGMLLTAMAETGAGAHETAMIGDTVYDIEMAVAAGCTAIGVSWGYHSVDDLRAAGATDIVDDFAQLTAWLKDFEGRINA